MPLIDCAVCENRISDEAEACPQCGHPNRRKVSESSENNSKCYSCSKPPTTKCQSCGALSCATHLDSIYVNQGYELRCSDCYSSAQTLKIFGWVLAAVIVIVALIMVGNL